MITLWKFIPRSALESIRAHGFRLREIDKGTGITGPAFSSPGEWIWAPFGDVIAEVVLDVEERELDEFKTGRVVDGRLVPIYRPSLAMLRYRQAGPIRFYEVKDREARLIREEPLDVQVMPERS
jgi:hypothetical protein